MFFFLIIKTKNNKIEKVKKFINVKLNGGNPAIVNAPRKNGIKNRTINLLLNKKSISKC